MKQIFVIAALTLSAASLASTQSVDEGARRSGNAAQEIMKIEREWIESRSEADATYSESLMADDYRGTTPQGTVQTKAAFIAEVKSGNHRGMSADHADNRVQVYGDIAVSTGRVAGVRYTRVYVRQEGRWRLVAAQATPVQQATSIQQTSNTSALRTSARRLPLKPCRVPGHNEEVLCGTLEVYENREARKGRKIGLNVVVLPALTSTPAPDPLFPLTGGPGQAATAVFMGGFADIRRERDVVLVDQRGTGKSNQLNCEVADINELVQAVVGAGVPVRMLKQCREQLEEHADLRFYSTPIAADDLDDVRAWLGYERINLYGGSYGTRPALAYLQQYPRRVRTVTLRAVYSPSYPLYSSRDTEQSLDRLFDDCAKDTLCAKAFPNLRQDLQIVLRRLAESPAKLRAPDPKTNQTIELTISRDVFAGALRQALYDTDLQRFIPVGIKRALNNDFGLLAPLVGRALALADSTSMGMNLSVHCSENVPQIRRGDVAREVKGTLISQGMTQNLIDRCKEWPRGQVPARYSAPVRSNVPVLIFSGALDPTTPPVWGAAVAKHLPNSLHVVMDGIAHSPFPSCAANLMTRFVTNGDTKKLDTACVKGLRRPPFVIPPGEAKIDAPQTP